MPWKPAEVAADLQRLRWYREDHGIIVHATGHGPAAFVGKENVSAETLGGLLDQLDARYAHLGAAGS